MQLGVAVADFGLVLHLLADFVVQGELTLSLRRLIVAADDGVSLPDNRGGGGG